MEGVHDDGAALHYEFDRAEDRDVCGKAANSRQFAVDSGKEPEKSSSGVRPRFVSEMSVDLGQGPTLQPRGRGTPQKKEAGKIPAVRGMAT